jgi:hypothetical protein
MPIGWRDCENREFPGNIDDFSHDAQQLGGAGVKKGRNGLRNK